MPKRKNPPSPPSPTRGEGGGRLRSQHRPHRRLLYHPVAAQPVQTGLNNRPAAASPPPAPRSPPPRPTPTPAHPGPTSGRAAKTPPPPAVAQHVVQRQHNRPGVDAHHVGRDPVPIEVHRAETIPAGQAVAFRRR